jgi:translation initiation factor 2 subunit 1
MVRVNSIDDMGVMCSLLEYNDLEGFLPLSEVSRKRMRSILRHVRVGQRQVLQVLRVDTERSYVDLSKKYVGGPEKEQGTDKFEKGKHVHSMTKRLAELMHQPVKEMYEKIVWPLYQNYKHPFDAMKALANEDEDIFKNNPEPVSEAVRSQLKKIALQRMAVQPVKLGAQIELTCYSFAGIEDIKRAIRAGLDASDGNDVKIQLISSPAYLVWLNTLDEDRGKQSLLTVIAAVKESILEYGGSCATVKEPQVIGKEFELAQA